MTLTTLKKMDTFERRFNSLRQKQKIVGGNETHKIDLLYEI
jgi:hypothetical protein